MTNKSNRVLYVGLTADLYTRVYEHKTKFYPNSFTAKYNINKPVYYEYFHFIDEAIAREGLNRIIGMIKPRDSYGTQTHRPEESASPACQRTCSAGRE